MSTHPQKVNYPIENRDDTSHEYLPSVIDPELNQVQIGVWRRITSVVTKGWKDFWDFSGPGWWAEKEQSEKLKTELENMFSGVTRKADKPHWPQVKGTVDGKTCIITKIPNGRGYFIAFHVNAGKQLGEGEGDGIERILITEDGQIVHDEKLDISWQANTISKVLASFKKGQL